MDTLTKIAYPISIDHIGADIQKKLPEAICKFLDVIQTATARATFYNKKGEQEKAVTDLHKNLFVMDRGIYSLCLLLPGINDYAKQVGMGVLLDNARPQDLQSLLDVGQEGKVLAYLSRFMPPQRLFKLYAELRQNRVNNARTKKLILRSILSSPKVDFWAIKYRFKLRRALEHAWDKRMTGIIRAILAKVHGAAKIELEQKEQNILRQHIDKFAVGSRFDMATVRECVAFILGHESRLTVPLFQSYRSARTDLTKGKGLPLSNLNYLRSRFHKDSPVSVILEVAKDTMTNTEKREVQRQAKEAKVEIKFDPMTADAVKLYIYAYEMGMTDDIEKALEQKARKAAESLFAKHDKVGIVVDTSESMRGHSTQAMRPIAIALATRDMLVASAKEAYVEHCGGYEKDGLIRPSGDTSLAEGLLRVLKKGPQAVFVFSDGYENAPAGRFAEVVQAVRNIGINTPIYQISPVMTAEGAGVRQLCEDVPSLPLSKPEAINIAVVKTMLQANLVQGLIGLATVALPRLGYCVAPEDLNEE